MDTRTAFDEGYYEDYTIFDFIPFIEKYGLKVENNHLDNTLNIIEEGEQPVNIINWSIETLLDYLGL